MVTFVSASSSSSFPLSDAENDGKLSSEKDFKANKASKHSRQEDSRVISSFKRIKTATNGAISTTVNKEQNEKIRRSVKFYPLSTEILKPLSVTNIDMLIKGLKKLDSDAFVELEVAVLEVRKSKKFVQFCPKDFYAMSSDQYYVIEQIEKLIELSGKNNLNKKDKSEIQQRFYKNIEALLKPAQIKKVLEKDIHTLIHKIYNEELILIFNNKINDIHELIKQAIKSILFNEGKKPYFELECYNELVYCIINELRKDSIEDNFDDLCKRIKSSDLQYLEINFSIDLKILLHFDEFISEEIKNKMKNEITHRLKFNLINLVMLLLEDPEHKSDVPEDSYLIPICQRIIKEIHELYPNKQLLKECCLAFVNFPDKIIEYANAIFQHWINPNS